MLQDLTTYLLAVTNLLLAVYLIAQIATM